MFTRGWVLHSCEGHLVFLGALQSRQESWCVLLVLMTGLPRRDICATLISIHHHTTGLYEYPNNHKNHNHWQKPIMITPLGCYHGLLLFRFFMMLSSLSQASSQACLPLKCQGFSSIISLYLLNHLPHPPLISTPMNRGMNSKRRSLSRCFMFWLAPPGSPLLVPCAHPQVLHALFLKLCFWNLL